MEARMEGSGGEREEVEVEEAGALSGTGFAIVTAAKRVMLVVGNRMVVNLEIGGGLEVLRYRTILLSRVD